MVDKNHDGIPDDVDPDHFRVAIFGSARLQDGDADYKNVYLLAHRLAELDIDVVTGGGPGLMEAANRGHKVGRKEHSGVHSFGLNIRLPREQYDNKFLDIKREFDVFSKRLDAFMLLSNVVVVAPGGVGTCLEFFYSWQLTQVKHTCKIPIILMGEMWHGLLKWIHDNPLKQGLLNKEDMNNIRCVNNWEEAATLIEEAYLVFKKAGSNACINLKAYGKRAQIDQIL
ncbi:MAG: LOG family protein [Candidatus Gracilibacteria bacterium]|nr:LOG family protein [bacterium]MDZ4217241.1 LOG family protein [Candidatus Gracilibacteria bacterium]